MSSRQDVRFLSQGVECAGWLYPPSSAPPWPGIVMGHGFSATRHDGLEPYARRFQAAGLAVLAFDYRHFGDSQGSPRQLVDIARQQQDFQAALTFMRSLSDVDDQRLGLFGTSFSGGHVVCVAAQDPLIRAVVAQCPFSDGLPTLRAADPANVVKGTLLGLADRLLSKMRLGPLYLPAVGYPGDFAIMTAPETKPGMDMLTGPNSPWRNQVAARIVLQAPWYRPVLQASKLSCPLLVCVCDKDQTAPAASAWDMARRAPRGEIRRYPVGHFEIYQGSAFEQAVADQLDFLSRHLGPG
jgi:pimeloyl-ACP methyl ester carboxylesterase